MKSRLMTVLICGLLAAASTAPSYARDDRKQQKEAQQLAEEAAADVELKCPKCQNAMERGFLLEDQGYTANQTDTKWVQGPVKKKHFPETDIETKVQRHVVSYRCTNCGYLESYAR